MKKTEKSRTGVYFLLIVILLYIIVAFLKIDAILPSLQFSLNIIEKIIPVFVLVFIMMSVVNYFVTPEIVKNYLSQSSGLKRWTIAVISGIISTGPIYMWYPLLKDLRKKGVNYGLISVFLYNRAIKIPLLPILIFYFSLKYAIVLMVVMIIASVIQGLIFEKIEGVFL